MTVRRSPLEGLRARAGRDCFRHTLPRGLQRPRGVVWRAFSGSSVTPPVGSYRFRRKAVHSIRDSTGIVHTRSGGQALIAAVKPGCQLSRIRHRGPRCSPWTRAPRSGSSPSARSCRSRALSPRRCRRATLRTARGAGPARTVSGPLTRRRPRDPGRPRPGRPPASRPSPGSFPPGPTRRTHRRT